MQFRSHWALYPFKGKVKITLGNSHASCDREATRELGRTDEENKSLCMTRGFFYEGSVSGWQEAVQRILNALSLDGLHADMLEDLSVNDLIPGYFLDQDALKRWGVEQTEKRKNSPTTDKEKTYEAVEDQGSQSFSQEQLDSMPEAVRNKILQAQNAGN